MDRSPFDSSDELMNISTGEIWNGSVNVHRAKDIGESIIGSMMEGLSVFDFSFKRRDTVETMPTISAIVIDNETIPVDHQLLFQRLMVIARQSPEELESNFTFELSTLPASLFDKDGLMHEANKPQLGDALWKTIGEKDPKVSDDTLYTLDGGSLLHKIPWKKWQTFDSICQSYVNHVLRYYGRRATVVFDGYQIFCKSFEGHQMLRSLYMSLTWDQLYANVFNFVVTVKFQVIMSVGDD